MLTPRRWHTMMQITAALRKLISTFNRGPSRNLKGVTSHNLMKVMGCRLLSCKGLFLQVTGIMSRLAKSVSSR